MADQASLVDETPVVDAPPMRGETPTKLRRMDKNEEELEAERNLFFELPRKKCEQLAPEVKKILNMEKKSESQHRMHTLRRIMKRARVKKVDQQLKLLYELDASERIVPHGQMSKNLYEQIFHSRDFDLYGNLMPPVPPHPGRKYLEMKRLAEELGVMFTQAVDPEAVLIVEDVEEQERLAELEAKKRIPIKKTDEWKIGTEPVYNAPVGFAKNKMQPAKSLGNDHYFSYDGDWSKGRMHGMGTYLYQDGGTYEGEFKDNKPDGEGVSVYPEGQRYSGFWRKGRFEGKGTTAMIGDSKYSGDYMFGRRHGHGRLSYPSGLVYVGEFIDGKPYGRGVITSKLTGWAWDGSFERGSISGSGVLITPPPDSKRIMQYWPSSKVEQTLPVVVRTYLQQQANERRQQEKVMAEIYGPLRGLQLKTYVNSIRQNLYAERMREKKEKFNEQFTKIKEAKRKLYEARLKALAGEED